MSEGDSDGTIEVVRGQLDERRADQILDFWKRESALEGPQARERLAEVVCVLGDGSGGVAGVNSVYARNVPTIGNRRFWIYRNLLPGDASRAREEMINAAFTALEEEFKQEETGPIGLCVIADPAEAQRNPEVIWPETELMLAGYLEGDQQVRVRYFWDAAIGSGTPHSPSLDETQQEDHRLEERFRLETFGEVGGVADEEVIAMWEREGVLPPEEARRRVNEVFLVAIDESEGVVGVSTTFLQRNQQLRLDLWYTRAFVARAHRESNLAAGLSVGGRDVLEERFVSGEDRRGAGMLYEVENVELRMYRNRALWLPPVFVFIGENAKGDHVRVHYFPGARVESEAD